MAILGHVLVLHLACLLFMFICLHLIIRVYYVLIYLFQRLNASLTRIYFEYKHNKEGGIELGRTRGSEEGPREGTRHHNGERGRGKGHPNSESSRVKGNKQDRKPIHTLGRTYPKRGCQKDPLE